MPLDKWNTCFDFNKKNEQKRGRKINLFRHDVLRFMEITSKTVIEQMKYSYFTAILPASNIIASSSRGQIGILRNTYFAHSWFSLLKGCQK